MTDRTARLCALAGDETQPQTVRDSARRALAAEEMKRTRAEQRAAVARGRAALGAPVRRYRVGGVWKLTERIADRDADGDWINGYSDRT